MAQKGKAKSATTKEKIARSTTKYCQENPDKKSEAASKAWQSRPEESKRAFQDQQGIQYKGQESKLFSFIYNHIENNYNLLLEKNVKNISIYKNHVDILIPEYRAIIQIDGPHHFLKINTQEYLNEMIDNDQRFDNDMRGSNYNVIHIQYHKFPNQFRLKKLLETLDRELADIPNRDRARIKYINVHFDLVF
jgi:hypothetical protein